MGDSGAIDDDESHSSRSRKNSQVHGEERYIELSPAASIKQRNLEQRMKKVEKKLDKLRLFPIKFELFDSSILAKL